MSGQSAAQCPHSLQPSLPQTAPSRTRGTTGRRRGQPWWIAAGLVALLAGCSADGSATSAAGSAPARDAAGSSAQLSAENNSAGTPAADTAEANRAKSDAAAISPVVAAGTQLARRADLTLEVAKITDAAASVRRVVLAANGQVLDEKFGSDGEPIPAAGEAGLDHGFGTMMVSVPSAALDSTLDELAKLGTVTNRAMSSEDLAATIVDTTSRVATMRESLARVRALMSQATTLSDVVALESELTRRQSDLEALESSLANAKDRVAQSPITVSLATGLGRAPSREAGFLGGLRAGWDAFVTVGSGLLTALGAALPFLIVAAAVGWPLTRWLRRRRPAVTPPTIEPAQL